MNNVMNIWFSILWKISSIISIIGGMLFLGMSYGYVYKNEMWLISICILYLGIKSLVFAYAPKSWLQDYSVSAVKQILKSQIILGPIYLLISITTLLTLLTFQMFGWYIYVILNIAMIVIARTYTDEYDVENKQ